MRETLSSSHLWKIAFGHHPYISNGTHGVAGHYDGFEEFPSHLAWIYKDLWKRNCVVKSMLFLRSRS